ncbi:uncharacterized protein LOC112592203 [Melanaphis sacchari]|uniref:uncharacterized protein LOC112592203 n=1 Tax=Melanaphis sacchari TaxID=742174 RepID=UPI000DC148E9|nr:uncharacterized protein LOC112592203 [Melanaphis sacchari]
MKYLSVPRMFAPYLKDKLYHSITRNEEQTLVKFSLSLYLKSMLQRDVSDNHRRNAGIRDDDIDNSENGGTNGYSGTNRNDSGYYCGAKALGVSSGYNDAGGPANNRISICCT